jgi:hypothetical protein
MELELLPVIVESTTTARRAGSAVGGTGNKKNGANSRLNQGRDTFELSNFETGTCGQGVRSANRQSDETRAIRSKHLHF